MGPFVLVPYAMGLIADGIILPAQQLLPCLLRLCPLPRLFVDSCSSTDESERNLILGESSATRKLSRKRLWEMNVGLFRSLWTFSNHNPTHKVRCLVRLPRSLAVPAVL
jgi:hypothetical protein